MAESDRLKINNRKFDKRVKLTEEDKEEIRELKGAVSQQKAADAYGVSRRTIEFIWYPEREEQNKQRRKERGGSKIYYDKEKQAKALRRHKKHKQKLHEKGLI